MAAKKPAKKSPAKRSSGPPRKPIHKTSKSMVRKKSAPRKAPARSKTPAKKAAAKKAPARKKSGAPRKGAKKAAPKRSSGSSRSTSSRSRSKSKAPPKTAYDKRNASAKAKGFESYWDERQSRVRAREALAQIGHPNPDATDKATLEDVDQLATLGRGESARELYYKTRSDPREVRAGAERLTDLESHPDLLQAPVPKVSPYADRRKRESGIATGGAATGPRE